MTENRTWDQDSMDIDHIHFYVENAEASRRWFIHLLNFEVIDRQEQDHTQIEVLANGPIRFVLSAPLRAASPVAQFLQQHPPGVVDVALRVPAVAALTQRVAAAGGQITQPVQDHHPWLACQRWGQIQGWGNLTHTLVERASTWGNAHPQADPLHFVGIDHVVLNVAMGDLQRAVAWYQQILGFQPQQVFAIQTKSSALYSQVLQYPGSQVKLPINEPASANSQIQEFLDLNRGPGVQHIALQTRSLPRAIATLRQRQLPLLSVPESYYEQLRQRPGFCLSEIDWQAIADLQILVDWQIDHPSALLLQTFSQPIFSQPTFFLEFIERQSYPMGEQLQAVSGFGEGNFQALFEAVEREQRKRGTLV